MELNEDFITEIPYKLVEIDFGKGKELSEIVKNHKDFLKLPDEQKELLLNSNGTVNIDEVKCSAKVHWKYSAEQRSWGLKSIMFYVTRIDFIMDITLQEEVIEKATEEEFEKYLRFEITDIEWTATSTYGERTLPINFEIEEEGGVSESGFLAPIEVSIDFENKKILVKYNSL